MPKFLSEAWSFLRRLPVARYIKPIWKGALQEAVQRGGDALQKELDAQMIAQGERGLAEVQKKIDGLQDRITLAIVGLPLPQDLAEKINQAINGPVDALQERLRAGCASGCVKTAQMAFDAAFDKFQADLAESIGKL